MDKIADRVLQINSDITLSQFLILTAVKHKAGISQERIAKFLELTQAAVSRQIEVLRKKKLILREENPQNRREHILSITKNGESKLKKSSKIIMSKFNYLYKVLNRDEKIAFNKSLDKIFEVLSKEQGI